MRWSLNKKLVLIMIALTAAMLVTMFVFNLYSERALYKAIQIKISEISESIHLAIEEMTKKEKPDEMRLYHYLKKIKSEGVQEIDIIDSATRITASTNPRSEEHTSELQSH